MAGVSSWATSESVGASRPSARARRLRLSRVRRPRPPTTRPPTPASPRRGTPTLARRPTSRAPFRSRCSGAR
uniref:Uncharacterized protein n=1 Tax=uncultured marine virus TaxID=186617 RepID=A0A0F7L3M6_9VIRU|nr:hypothetical protein [uncultured marine virus]